MNDRLTEENATPEIHVMQSAKEWTYRRRAQSSAADSWSDVSVLTRHIWPSTNIS